MDKKSFLRLLDKYLAGKASLEEEQQLLNFYGSFQETELWDEQLLGTRADMEAKMLGRIQNKITGRRLRFATSFPAMATATAAAVALMLLGVYFFSYHSISDKTQTIGYTDIAPGKNKATLTVAGGSTIQLSETKKGVEIGASALTYDDGSVVKEATWPAISNQSLLASTPAGGVYQFVLPDGTVVLLNAASTLKFPSSFSGLEKRTVELVGEAYFEVAKDKLHPFIVKSRQQEIRVLGTHFNVNSYEDESVTTTTLLEGLVTISSFNSASGRTNTVLKPGQQSILNEQGAQLLKADMDEAMAWKNGDFIFRNEPLERIMRKVSRWYNIDIAYAPDAPKNATLVGFISRSRNLSAVLKMIEETGNVHFKVEGRKVTVMP
jgi:transmembrane sensor